MAKSSYDWTQQEAKSRLKVCWIKIRNSLLPAGLVDSQVTIICSLKFVVLSIVIVIVCVVTERKRSTGDSF